MQGIIPANYNSSALDTLIARVSCVEDQLSTTVKELGKSPDFSRLPNRESAWIAIQASLNALWYALREARRAITTEQLPSTKTKSLSTLNDIPAAIEALAVETAVRMGMIALRMRELGKDFKTGIDG